MPISRNKAHFSPRVILIGTHFQIRRAQKSRVIGLSKLVSESLLREPKAKILRPRKPECKHQFLFSAMPQPKPEWASIPSSLFKDLLNGLLGRCLAHCNIAPPVSIRPVLCPTNTEAAPSQRQAPGGTSFRLHPLRTTAKLAPVSGCKQGLRGQACKNEHEKKKKKRKTASAGNIQQCWWEKHGKLGCLEESPARGTACFVPPIALIYSPRKSWGGQSLEEKG